MQTLTPAIMLRAGIPSMALGSIGGDAQPQIHVQLLSAMIDFELNIQQAISAPRWQSGHFSLAPAQGSTIELGGQNDVDKHLSQTIAKTIVINPDTHVFEGATDPRCDGLAPGW